LFIELQATSPLVTKFQKNQKIKIVKKDKSSTSVLTLKTLAPNVMYQTLSDTLIVIYLKKKRRNLNPRKMTQGGGMINLTDKKNILNTHRNV
jgi:hypothetical protein